MENCSILFLHTPPKPVLEKNLEVIVDLCLDQVIRDITNSRRSFKLHSIFRQPLDYDNVIFRQEIFRDLRNPEIRDCIYRFSEDMEDLFHRESQLKETVSPFQKQWYLASKIIFEIKMVHSFYTQLISLAPSSFGFRRLLDCLGEIIETPQVLQILNEAESVLDELKQINYSLKIKGDSIEVLKSSSLGDYQLEIQNTFERFRLGEVKDYTYRWNDMDYRLNGLEEEILKGVARLFPKAFDRLKTFYEFNSRFKIPILNSLYEELQFYLTVLDYIRPLADSGLPFCIPEFNENREVNILEGFDLNLVNNLSDHEIVFNNFNSDEAERVFIITGANQGGKTTFARMVGQIFYFASIGIPVAALKADLFLTDHILTHFEHEEDVSKGNGLLKDDLIRIKKIIDKASKNSLIILNEIFSSTTLHDAIVLGAKVLAQLKGKESLCLYVTFINQLSRDSETVSLTTQIDENQNRTFKIQRRDADGKAYAMSVAQKYGLTYETIKELLNQ